MPRVHLELAARRGNPSAIAALAGPEYPDAVEYLHGLLWQVHGRSGASMNGLAPLSWGTLRDFRDFTGVRITGDDARALMRLDAILLSPGDEKAEAEESV